MRIRQMIIQHSAPCVTDHIQDLIKLKVRCDPPTRDDTYNDVIIAGDSTDISQRPRFEILILSP